MPQIWLYHINPRSAYGYGYGWDTDEPKTIFNTDDLDWSSRVMFKKVAVDDLICVYMKNMRAGADGVYVAGTVQKIMPKRKRLLWQPSRKLSAYILRSPITKKTIGKFFPRSFGLCIQLLDPDLQKKWMGLIKNPASQNRA